MPEVDAIDPDYLPLTVDSLTEQFASCGLSAGQTVLVHTRMSALGWITGGPVAVVQALMRVISPSGTLMMPTHNGDNSDPAAWQNPPVPEHWWPIIRAHTPAYEPAITPSRGMGVVAELFRRWPGVIRSSHPNCSFAAWGANAAFLTENHARESALGEGSPLARLYDLDGYILLLGVGHANNTSLHLAEYRADYPSKGLEAWSAAVLVDGVRQWVTYQDASINGEDFAQIGEIYEATFNIPRGRVGRGEAHFMKQRPLVDFAVQWMEAHRR
jgi:aminoglycoside 3-N-acetyltransferase